MQLTALKRAAWAAAALLVTTATQAEISDNVVKIGVLSDMNGPASTPTGQGSVTAAQMAVDDFGGKVLDKPISVIVGDHQLKPDIGAAIARRWYDTEQVDLIVDVPVSAVGLAVQTIATEKKRLFITQSTGAADFHGKFCSPYAMQWVFDTRALATGTAKEVVKRGGDSWFFITDDYAFGHSLERDAAGVVTANGGKVIGGVKHPLNTSDFSSFLLQAQSSGAKVIGLANAGGDTTNSIKQAAEFGITKGGQKLAALLLFLTDVKSIGLDIAQGLNFTETFYWDMNDQTRAFSERFAKRMKNGAPPTMVQAGVYAGLLHYFKALEALGENPHDGVKIVEKMKSIPTEDALFGKGEIQPNGRTIHTAYLFEVKKPSESKAPWDLYKLVGSVPGDQAFTPLDKSACALLKK